MRLQKNPISEGKWGDTVLEASREGQSVRLGHFVDPHRRCLQSRHRHRTTGRPRLSCLLKMKICRPSPPLHQTNPSPSGSKHSRSVADDRETKARTYAIIRLGIERGGGRCQGRSLSICL